MYKKPLEVPKMDAANGFFRIFVPKFLCFIFYFIIQK
jgi:hypothetical protein